MKPLNSNEKDILLLDLYLKGQLTETERSEVERRLHADLDFQADYEYLKKVMADARISALSSALNVLKDAETQYSKEQSTKNPKLQVSWKKYAIAASLLLPVIYFASRYFTEKKAQIPVEYADVFAKKFDQELILHQTFRAVSIQDSLSPEQRRAYELYSLRQFDLAAPLLQGLWEGQRDTLALFYWGISELGSGRVEKGEEILRQDAVKAYPRILK